MTKTKKRARSYQQRQLDKVTGKWLKGCYDWLVKEGCGCCHLPFDYTAHHRVCVCVGWHNLGDGQKEKNYEHWGVAWKIGWEAFNNGMQTDLDIDFDMPYNTEAYCERMNALLTEEERKRGKVFIEGDVYDTEEPIVLKASKKSPVGYRSWEALAAFVRKTARDVAKYAKEVEPDESEE